MHLKPSWKPEDSDGCTFWPDGNYIDCCWEHDESYAHGGTWWDRVKADWKLAKCVHKKGKERKCRACQTVRAALMLIGVNVLGSFLWPYHHKWGEA